jgi:cytochrome c-type biogenesis protein CcmF
MLPELGHFALILALLLSLLLSAVPLTGVLGGNRLWMGTARPLVAGQFVFVAIAFALLVAAFVNDDFSVAVVSKQSNSLLPMIYKVSALWGGHEGSLLLWMLMLSGWTLAVAVFSRSLPNDMVATVLSVMGMVAVGFLLFSLLTSNPFERTLPNVPMEGADLNPLLQDFAMAIHPPMLYCGYVGFSVAFAFAIAALVGGRFDAAWARWTRPWTTAAWIFLTFGIMLGSWWAYYELGWGGWWFWDPVENASFMPWLVGTALLHSLAVTEKRGAFKTWTLLLAIFAFSLSLLGTFLVRSGVLTSVHSFAADPERGMFILAFLGIVVGGSLVLYALRAPTVGARVSFGSGSRELFLLFNNVILVIAAVSVLLGTLFPLIADALDIGKYSVGAPYFNAIFVPLMSVLASLLGAGIHASWKQTRGTTWKQLLLVPLVASVVIGLMFPFLYGGEFRIFTTIAIVLAAWIVLSIVFDIRQKLRHAPSLANGLRRLGASYYGMQAAHLGFAIAIIGTTLTTQYSYERDLRMTKGESVDVRGYQLRFDGTEIIKGPNYQGDRGHLVVSQDGKVIATLTPEKRAYFSQRGNVMTEAAIDASLFRDIYVAMGESLGAEGAWAIRIHYKPFVRWIWLGALFMVFGGIVAVLDKRYRRAADRVSAAATAGATRHV